MATNPLNIVQPFPYRLNPVSGVTPFTYRDGATFLQILEGMRKWLNENLVPDFNGTFENIIAEFQVGIENAEKTVENYDARMIQHVKNFTDAFDLFMSDVTANIGVLNEAAVAGIIDNKESVARAAIDRALLDLAESKMSLIRTFLDSAYSKRGEFSANVLDYGVVADKTKDSSAGFQSALNAVRDAGGGTVFVPNPGPGQEYRLGGRPTIYPNTTFKVEPGTVIRRWGGSFGLVNIPPNGGNPLENLKDPYSGYGNIIIDGGIWEGYAPDAPLGNDGYGEGFNCFYFAVARNLTLRNLTVRNMATNHAVDVNGIDGMLIENCEFLGYHDTSAKADRNYTEAIQYSPFFEDGENHPYRSFTEYTNGLASINMVISKCKFSKSEQLPAWPAAFGNHSAQNASRGELTGKVSVNKCRFEGQTFSALTLWTFDNVSIESNTFTGCQIGIKANNFGGGRRWNTALRVWETAPYRQAVSNHLYANNTFIDTVDCDITVLGTGNAAADNSWATISNVKVMNNTRVRNVAGRSKGPMVRALLCDNVTISGNSAVKSSTGIQVEACRNTIISDNLVDETSGYGILVMAAGKPASEPVGYATDVIVSNNTVSNSGSHGIGVNDMVRVSIISNAIKNPCRLSAGNGILSGASDTVLISANRITCTSTPFATSGIAGFNSKNMVTTLDNVVNGENNYKVTAIVNDTSVYDNVKYTS